MSEFSRYSPPENDKQVPLTFENRFERVELDKSPERKPGLDDGRSPTPPPAPAPQDDQTPTDTSTPAEMPEKRQIGSAGISSMQGDAPTDDPTPPASTQSDTDH